MKVSVIGPNGINDATFHVHRAGCLDIRRYKRIERPWDMDADREQDVVECCFADFIDSDETWTEENGYTSWEDYRHEVRFFPCVSFPVVYADWELELMAEVKESK
jgi:hypothetical protein